MLKIETEFKLDAAAIKSPNLCDRFTDKDLVSIGEYVWHGYDQDKGSRSKWERRNEAAMDLAMQVQRDKNFPWPGSANVVFPLITIAALQFSARSYPAIIQGTDVVRYRVIGKDHDGTVMEMASRIGRHMSWQVLEEDQAWEEQHDRLLINLAIVGSNFVKTYFSGAVNHNVSELVMARDLVMDYWAKSVEDCPRKTHTVYLSRNEIYERIMLGIYTDVREENWFKGPPLKKEIAPGKDNRQGQVAPQPDMETPYFTLEQHCVLDLDGDGYAEPYIVTVEESSKQVLRLVARVDEESAINRNDKGEIISIKATEYFTKYSFIPSPDGGIYDLGFGAFLGPINEAVSTAINQLLDAGTLQNSIGGFLGRGAKIRGGVYNMAPYEWKRVDSSGDDLRKNLVPFPERKPLDVTFQLIGLLIEYADRLAGTTDPMVGVNPGQNTPAETSRNMTEQGSKVYSMIFKRVWRSMKEEFKKLYKLNSVFLRSHQNFGNSKDFIRREDYLGNPDLIAPVADPNITSATMQISQAITVKQAAMTTAGYDQDEAEKRFLKALKVENIESLYLGKQKTGPLPNPKVMAEQIKAQVQMAKVQAEKAKWANELLAERQKVDAEILLLKAQAAQILVEVGEAQAARQLEAFKIAITAFEKYNDAITDRIKALTGGQKDGEETDGGGVPGMGGKPNDQGVPGDAQPQAAGPDGAMGGGPFH